MAKGRWTAGIVMGFILLLLSLPAPANTQIQHPWQGPLRLSTDGAEASEAFMVADHYGYVHAFWREVHGDDRRNTIQYRRFDGQVWSRPLDIYVAPPGRTVGYLSPAVDEQGTLFLLWTEGNSGPVFQASAAAHNALSAQAWTQPRSLDMPAYRLRLQIDADGVLHILYSEFYGSQPGVYYARSEDMGFTWSAPRRLDPDIPFNQSPNVLHFVVDDKGGLHALWYYAALDVPASPGTSVRYAHSLDGGTDWSAPFTVDVADDEPDELRLPHPELAVSGDDIHVVWAGDSMTHREHRVSNDRGRTWSATRRILGDLHGQGLGGQLVTDGLGRIHYLAQIRWPQAIWHTIWEGNRWRAPSAAYLIARTAADDIGPGTDRIHAHNIRAALSGGNQLVVTFTNSPGDPEPLALYTMHRALADVPGLEPLPTPAPPVSVTLTPSPLPPRATSTPTLEAPPAEGAPPGAASRAQSILFLGVVPSLLLVAAIIALRSWRNLTGGK